MLSVAIDKLIEYKTSDISVVDGDNHIMGFISDGDLLRWLFRQDARVFSDNFPEILPEKEGFDDKAKRLLWQILWKWHRNSQRP